MKQFLSHVLSGDEEGRSLPLAADLLLEVLEARFAEKPADNDDDRIPRELGIQVSHRLGMEFASLTVRRSVALAELGWRLLYAPNAATALAMQLRFAGNSIADVRETGDRIAAHLLGREMPQGRRMAPSKLAGLTRDDE